MATLFQGRSEAEWLQLFDEVKAEQLALIRGDRFLSVSTGGKSYSRRVRASDEIRADYGEALSALQILNPTTYGHPTSKTYVAGNSYQFK